MMLKMTTRQNEATALQVRPISVRLCDSLSFALIRRRISFPFSFQIFSIVHVCSRMNDAQRFSIICQMQDARTHTQTQRKMMKISRAVGKIEILHMINGRNGENIKNSYEINENEMIKQFLWCWHTLSRLKRISGHNAEEKQRTRIAKNMHISCDANVCNNCCQFFLWARKANETI